MKRIVVFILSIVALSGCDRDLTGFFVPPSDSVEQRFRQSMEWNRTHGYPVINVAASEYQFYCATDVHVEGSNDNIRTFVSRLRNDAEAVFGVLLGDLVHDKGQYPLLMEAFPFDPAIHAENDTIFSTVGNHDLYFGQWEDYRHYWGTSCLYFTVVTPVGYDLFVLLDTGSGTLGHSQLEWMKEVMEEWGGEARHIVVCTHTDLLRMDNTGFPSGNMNMEETLELTALMQSYGVDLYLQGHNHMRHETTYRDVRYITIETIQDKAERPAYLVSTMGDTIELDFITEL